jgi:hypothetical protein
MQTPLLDEAMRDLKRAERAKLAAKIDRLLQRLAWAAIIGACAKYLLS